MKNSFKKYACGAAVIAIMGLPLTNVALAETTTGQKVEAGIDKAGEAVSDSWITSKVKSTFLADSKISGTDIKVETNKGVVSLSGTVKTDAERELAIQKAKEIKGVKAVAADGLKAAQ